MDNLILRNFEKDDWNAVRKIYLQGIESRNATFETSVPEYEVWIAKFDPKLLWVASKANILRGWAGLQPVSSRAAYRGVLEVTIYVDKHSAGAGVGSALMRHLISESEKAGAWTLFASIFPENIPSIRLHQKNGFREVGYRERIAQLDGEWRNTILFERRSKVVGQ